jgi:hypothetical protein
LIAVDTNILVYAHREELPLHEAARQRLIELAQSPARWAIPVFCLGEWIRVITHPKLFDNPHTASEAADALSRIMESPSLMILSPGERYGRLFGQAIEEADAIGNLVFDAQIVAVCREAGVRELLTEDRDFDRFEGFPVQRL